jgi:hypothetical protein
MLRAYFAQAGAQGVTRPSIGEAKSTTSEPDGDTHKPAATAKLHRKRHS